VATPGSAPVVGLLEVPTLNFGTSPSPMSSATVAIGSRQVAQFLSANMSFTAQTESP
jgi:hypothetical protein